MSSAIRRRLPWCALVLLAVTSLPRAAPPAPAGDARQAIDAMLAEDRRPDAAGTRELVQAGAILVDVRSAGERQAGHVRDARPLPWNAIDEQSAHQALPDKNLPIVTHCAVGARAWLAARSLRELGYTHVIASSVGYEALKQVGLPAIE